FSDQVKKDMEHVYRHDGIQSFKIFMAYRGAIGVDDVELVQVLDVAHDLGIQPQEQLLQPGPLAARGNDVVQLFRR
ncbi:MAG: hypothetical protein ABL962_18085, partial [Fimbriimonadaceae bacterium]